MRRRWLRWMPLLAVLAALLTWNEARSVDYVVSHIECPATIHSTETFPEKIGSNPPFHPLIGVNARSIHPTYSEPTIVQHGQWVNCIYYKKRSYTTKTYPAEFGYKVERKIVSCVQKSPSAIECRLEQK